MPPIDKIKILRKQVNCTLQQAISLLNQTYRDDGTYDIEQAVALFHQQNIDRIHQATDDIELAEVYYDRYRDVKKAIDKIKIVKANTVAIIVLTIQPNEYIDRVGFYLYKEDSDNNLDAADERLFMQTSDFSYAIKAFKNVFPTYNYRIRQQEDCFDSCFDNHFDVKQCQAIVDNLYALNECQYCTDSVDNALSNDNCTIDDINHFRLSLIDWIVQRFLINNESAKYHLVVEGNM